MLWFHKKNVVGCRVLLLKISLATAGKIDYNEVPVLPHGSAGILWRWNDCMKMNISMNNSYIEIDTGTLLGNARAILESLGGAELIPVLKDDAYGLGMAPVAAVLCTLPEIRCIALSHVSEGLALRAAGNDQELLIMSAALPFQMESAVEADLTLTCGRLGFAAELAEAARKVGKKAKLQVKIDAGLHRIGLEPDELAAFAEEYHQNADALDLTGVYSHFSDAEDLIRSEAQYALYLEALQALEGLGVPVKQRHMSNSAASERYPQFHLDAVRIGRRLFMDRTEHPLCDVKEAASWRSYITSLKQRKAGDRIGYNGAVTLKQDAMIATVGVGYGDGLHQDLFKVRAPVLVGGKHGHLLVCCMDQCMIDVTGIDCAIGDEVTFFGYDGSGNFLSAQAQAALINDDEGCGLTSALSPRVKRIYT